MTHWLRHAFPAPCLLCLAPAKNANVCDDCTADLHPIITACPRCAVPMATNILCGACLNNLPAQDASISLYPYKTPIDKLIAAFKYNAVHSLADDFASAFCTRVTQPLPQYLVPIPLHPTRLRSRGYNQSHLLASALSVQLDIPVAAGLITRIRNTPPQTELPFTERARNIRDAFQATITDMPPSHIALIDDVMTTGHTAQAATQVLKEAGIARVDVWTIARAVRQR